jgi:hypothetical protein
MILRSTITCPHCATAKLETMPTDACQFVYVCMGCGTRLRPKEGHCCVFCSYGSVPLHLSQRVSLHICSACQAEIPPHLICSSALSGGLRRHHLAEPLAQALPRIKLRLGPEISASSGRK